MPNDTYDIGVKKVSVVNSDIMQPIDIQSRLSTTTQTHNAVSVAANAISLLPSTFIDCNGYSDISITAQMGSAYNWRVDVHWSNDGTTVHGIERNVIASDTNLQKAGTTKIKARYAKVSVYNQDATNANTASAWAYLTT
jgi:hypothetical protein